MAAADYNSKKEILDKAFQLKKEDKYRAARDLLQEGLDNYPENRYIKTSLAQVFIRLNRFKEAQKLADEVLENHPEDHQALTVLGTLAYKKRNYEKALAYYKDGYTAREVEFIATRIIRTYIKLKEYQKALEWCQEWLEKEPDSEFLLKLKAEIFKYMGKTKKAQKIYKKYRDREPEDEFAYKEELKLKIKDKSPEEAVKQLKQLLRIGNRAKNPHLHTLLAEKQEEIEKYQEAVSSYKKALELNPEDKYILNRLGLCLLKSNKKEQALNYLKQAFRKDPSDYFIRSKLESVFKKEERYEEGIEFFKDIIEKKPSFNNLWGTIKKLQKKAPEK